jgi:hypothetical protein
MRRWTGLSKQAISLAADALISTFQTKAFPELLQGHHAFIFAFGHVGGVRFFLKVERHSRPDDGGAGGFLTLGEARNLLAEFSVEFDV